MKIDDYKCKAFKLSKHKWIEFQVSRWKDAKWFELGGTIRRKHLSDHQGFSFEITIAYHELSFAFYDDRHVENRKIKVKKRKLPLYW